MNGEIEAQIQTAVAHAAPNLIERVLLSCQDIQAGTVPDLSKRKKHWIFLLPAIAAALILCAGLFGFLSWRISQTVDSVVMLDVNPCVSLTVNARDKVLDAQALNGDGQAILGNMDLKGVDLETAVNALIGSMVRTGYLSDLQNSILISVDASGPEKAAQLQARLTAMVDELMQNSQLDASVLSQSVSKDDVLESLAAQYGISLGKAALIQELADRDPNLTFEALVPLSVNELALISDSRHLALPAVSQSGSASDKAYIGQDAAIDAACTAANLSRDSVSRFKVEFDSEDGLIVYDVDLTAGGIEYECKVHASTGAVLSCHSEYEDSAEHHSGGHHHNQPPDGGQIAAPPPEVQIAGPPDDTEAGEAAPAVPTMLTAAQAEDIALTHAGVAAEAAAQMQIELDFEDGAYIYELEFHVGSYEYEYIIDAYTGVILTWELDD